MNPSTQHPAPARIALITGSSSGFGLLTALTLAQQGFTVIATMRDLNRRQALEEQAAQQGMEDRIRCLQLDVTEEQSIHIAVQTVLQQYGHINVLVNNAGYAAGGFIKHVPMQGWRLFRDMHRMRRPSSLSRDSARVCVMSCLHSV